MGRLLFKILLSWSLWLPLLVTGQDLSGEIISINQPGCEAPYLGSITVAAINGDAPYTYTLDGSLIQSTGNFSSVSLGNHSITISDNSGADFGINFTIEINNQLIINVIDLSHVDCFGDGDGSISVVASSGVSPFQFSIDGGVNFQATGVFDNLSAGVYEIIAIDASNCYDTVSAEIIALSHINVLSLNKVNVDCFGDSTGSVQLIGELGTSPYQYSMDGINYQTDGVFTTIYAGIHHFFIEDLNGCTDSITLSFSEPSEILMSDFIISAPQCFNGNSGEINFSAAGGVSPYTYLLNGANATNTPSFQNLTANDYTIQMIDNNSCELDSLISIGQPDSLYFDFLNVVMPSCNGQNNGSIEISGIGGVAPYDYKIGSGSWGNSGLFTGLSAGDHTLKVRDASGCVFTEVYTLNEPSELSVSLVDQTNVYCNISTTGSIEVLASGGSAPFLYSLNGNPAQSLGLFTSLSSGLYTINVTDFYNCSTSIDVEIIETISLSIDDVIVDPAICGLSAVGQFTVQVSGGLSPYEYSLDNGALQSSNIFTNVGIGMHDIAVFTSDGCSVLGSYFLGEISELEGNVLSQIDPVCEGGLNGSISLEGSGGIMPYSYSFDGGMTWQLSGDFSGLTDSTYFFRIRDINLCSFDTLITFEEQSNLTLDLLSISAAICPGSGSGTIAVSGQNGVLPYSYSINNGTYFPSGVFNGLNPGEFTLSVMDANGCLADSIFTIDALETPAINIDSLISPTCNSFDDGVIMISSNGSETPYSYSFEGGGFSSNNYFNNLTAGTYTIVVQDNNSCLKSFDIELEDLPVFDFSIDSIVDVACKDEETGFIYYTFSGGLGPYSVSINSGSWQNAGNFLGPLYAGVYQLDFEDNNGCPLSTIEQVDQPLNALNISILSVVNVDCVSDTSGSVLGYATGGSGSYEYSLDGINYQASSSFINLAVGNYSLYVKDANECVETESFSIISNFPISLFWTSVVSPSCESIANGAIDIGVVSSSTPPFSFSMNNGPVQNTSLFSNLGEGLYEFIVEDENGCTAYIDTLLNSISDLSISVDSTQNIVCVADSSGAFWLSASGGSPGYTFYLEGDVLSGNNVVGLNNGVYQTWVMDAVGCTDSTEVAVLQESLLQGSIYSQQNILCNNGELGSVTINGTTGTSPYLYSMDGINFSSQNTFTDLVEGNYVLTIQDALACFTTIDVNIISLVQLDLSTQFELDPNCYGASNGSVSLSISNGIGPYDYSINGQAVVNDPLFLDLTAGVHSFYVEDSQGCFDTLTVQLNDPPQIQILLDSMGMASCFGVADAYLDVSCLNNQGAVNYTIAPGGITNTEGLFVNLAVDDYTINVLDEYGCEVDSMFSITSPELMDLSYELLNPMDCYGDDNAIIEIIASGGTQPFTYFIDSVSNGSNQFVNNLNGGEHTFVVVDQNNCQAAMDFDIFEPDSIYWQFELINDISCYGLNNGSVFFLANGGSGDFTYNLNAEIASTGLYDSLAPGNYTMIASDTSNCSIQLDFIIEEPALLEIDTVVITPPSCDGNSDASIEILVNGGSPNYNYFIPGTGNSSENAFTDLDAGAYYISVTDMNGCNSSQIVLINDPEVFELGLTTLTPPLCHGDSTAKVILQSSGGNGSAVYGLSWTNTTADSLFDGLPDGLSTFYGIDILGCRDSLTVYIPPTDSMTFNANVYEPTCYNLDNAWVQFAASGGASDFEYSMDSISWNSDGNFNGLGSELFTFYVQDGNGCIKDTTLFIDQPDSLMIALNFVHPVTCSDPYSGSIEITITGGNAPYESILNDDTLNGAYVSFTGLEIGSYQIITNDYYDCEAIFDTSIFEVDSLDIYVAPVELNCFGDNNGVATVIFDGGSGDYLISWDNITADQTASTQANLEAGVSYTVLVSDSLDQACSATAQVTPTQPEEIQFELFPFSGTCDPNDVSVSVNIVSGGVEPFQYAINNQVPVSSGIFTNLYSVSTSFKVIDADGCIESEWYLPENPNDLEAYFEISDNVVSMADGEVVFTDLSDNAEFYKWDFGDNVIIEGMVGDPAIGDETSGSMLQPIHNYTTFGVFNAVLEVISDFGCESNFERTITVEEDHLIYIPNSFTPDNDGVNDVFNIVGVTVQEDGYSLTIYDRSGAVVFESYDRNQGWDGILKNGSFAQPDVFVYMVRYYSGEKLFEKNGTITLLR